MNNGGRPMADEPYRRCSLSIAKSVYNRFDKYCKENCINKSKMIEKILTEYIKENM